MDELEHGPLWTSDTTSPRAQRHAVARRGRPSAAPSLILHALLRCGPLTRSEFASQTPISRATIRYWLGDDGPLVDDRLIAAAGDGTFDLGPGLGSVLAFSLSEMSVDAAIVTAAGRATCLHTSAADPDQLRRNPAELYARLRDLASNVIASAREQPGLLVNTAGDGRAALPLLGAAMAWPAELNRAGQLEDRGLGVAWRARSAREHLSQAIGFPLERCHAIETANAGVMALARDLGMDSGYGAVMCVYLGSTVSVGTFLMPHPRQDRLPFIDGSIVGGRHGTAGKVGHVTVSPDTIRRLNDALESDERLRSDGVRLNAIDPQRHCYCGGRGHFEALFGLSALGARLASRHEPRSSNRGFILEELREALEVRDLVVRVALNQTGEALADVLAGAIVALDPQKVTLIGPLALEDVCDGVHRRLNIMDLDATRADLYVGDEPGIVPLRGAGLAVLRAALYRRFFDEARAVGDGAQCGWLGWDSAATTIEGETVSYTPKLLR